MASYTSTQMHMQLQMQSSTPVVSTRASGRGGAGNYASQPSGAATSAATQEQLLANRPGSTPTAPTKVTGRGGAGNFLSGSDDASGESDTHMPSRRPSNTGTSRPIGLSGRGGAGNWSFATSKSKSAADGEAKRRLDEMQQQVIEQVDQGLKVPEPVHGTKRRVES